MVNGIQKNITGQTVVELLVALTLIILFLSGVVILQLFAIRNVDFARNKSYATRLSRQQLERARVIRDSSGFSGLNLCLTTCYINAQLTPVPITPTGVYGQRLVIESASVFDCPNQANITPAPILYKATALTTWQQDARLTPKPEVVIASCLTDWR